MSGLHGRIRLALLVCLCLIPLLVAGWVQMSYGWGPSAAARQAVLDHLAQLPRQAAADLPGPKITGRDATPAEAAALGKVVEAFLGCIKEGNFEGSWEAVDAESAEGWTQDQWVEALQATNRRDYDMSGLPSWPDTRIDIDRVRTFGQHGVAILVFRCPIRAWVALRRQGNHWLVDLTETMRLLAWHDARRQTPPGVETMRMLLQEASSGDLMNDGFLSLLVLAPTSTKYEATSYLVDGDRAVVRLEGAADLYFALRLRLSNMTWQFDYGAEVVDPKDIPDDLKDFGASQACSANLKQLSLGMLQYAADYDERYPPAAEWCAVIEPYVRNSEVYECPAVPGQYGYAMNYKLSRIEARRISSPAWTIQLFDSTLLRPNAHDYPNAAGASAAWPSRHNHVINYALADGRVEGIEQLVPASWYRVVRPPRSHGPRAPGGPGGPGGPPGGPPPAPSKGGWGDE